MMTKPALCYCGSNFPFDQCCQAIISKSKLAQTPEQLMRSRFSAYAHGDYQYIFDTYAKEKRKNLSLEDIIESGKGCHWFALKIHNTCTSTITEHNKQTVEFSAFYIVNDILCEMHEKSSFILEKNEWRYLDGDIIKHEEISKLTRNQLCPCNNYPSAWTSAKKAKKYKQCCGK